MVSPRELWIAWVRREWDARNTRSYHYIVVRVSVPRCSSFPSYTSDYMSIKYSILIRMKGDQDIGASSQTTDVTSSSATYHLTITSADVDDIAAYTCNLAFTNGKQPVASSPSNLFVRGEFPAGFHIYIHQIIIFRWYKKLHEWVSSKSFASMFIMNININQAGFSNIDINRSLL